ncbi:MAG: DUF3179 domain-containing protein [Chloroflexi bacterium]|nr:DUF3179 domain-containing protein [Chloroflexota bacterium]
MVYARQFGEDTLTFGVSGKLIMNNLVMYDHQTDSLWSQWTGDAFQGEFKGTKLKLVPSMQTTWTQWKQLHPDTLLMNKKGAYYYDIYDSYYDGGEAGIIGETRQDDRLRTKEFVLGLTLGGEAKAYSFRNLNDHTVVNDSVGGTDVVVTYDPRAPTATAFSREMGGRILTFRRLELEEDNRFLMIDEETNSQWLMVTGEAIEGALKGSTLEKVPSHYAFWFAWKDWHPSTSVFLRDAHTP